MSTRRFVKLGLETLGERIVPSANPFEIHHPVEVTSSRQFDDSNYQQTNPTSPTVGGIEPINPLPPLGGGSLGTLPTMPIDPAKEAAILLALQADLAETLESIDNLDPTSPTYEEELTALELRAGLDSAAIAATGEIAANVLAFAELSGQASALAGAIAPMLENPPTTVAGWNTLLGLLTQYSIVVGQMNELVNTTMQLMNSRAEIMDVLGIPTGY